MKILVLALKILAKLSSQDALFEAFKEVAERKTKIKLVKLDEQTDLRVIENDIKEFKATRKLRKLIDKGDKKDERKEKRQKRKDK